MIKNKYLLIIASFFLIFFFVPIILFLTHNIFVQTLPEIYYTIAYRAIADSFYLLIMASALALCWALPTAYICAFYHFKYIKLVCILLVLPLSVPAYLNAFSFSEVFYYHSSLTFIHSALPINFYWDVHSLFGASLVLSFSLYPYIFLPLYIRLKYFPVSYMDMLTIKKSSFFERIRFVILPLSWPMILAGLVPVIMEIFSDYGVAAFYGIGTISVLIFDLWAQSSDVGALLKLCTVFIAVSVLFLSFEGWVSALKKKQDFLNASKSHHRPHSLGIWGSLACFALCFIPIMGGIGLSFCVFVYQAFSIEWLHIKEILSLLYHSLIIAFIVAFITLIVATIFCIVQRFWSFQWLRKSIMLASSGYAFPGTVIAVIIMIYLTSIDRLLGSVYLTYGVLPLIITLSLKFLTIPFQYIVRSEKLLPTAFWDMIHLHSASFLTLMRQCYIPMINSSLLISFLIVMIDVLKELPISLLLRPFGYENLAIYSYNMALSEKISYAAPVNLLIIFLGAIGCFITLKRYYKI